jgi:hypothetical protein
MEISKYLPGGDLVFIADGNTYIKMLNDLDNKLCDSQHLQVIGDTIKFTARNPNLIDIGHKNKVYPAFNYQRGKPSISHYWTDAEYVPTYIGYHDLVAVSSDTLKLFDIEQPIVNKYELQSNERLLDKEYLDIMHIGFKKSKYIRAPNIVSVYGKLRRINGIVDELVPVDTDDSDTDEYSEHFEHFEHFEH